ncbi:MAG: alpha/beta hydrolase-fold protein [Planctomycetota bacterium]|jgi:dienelactone hydrolase
MKWNGSALVTLAFLAYSTLPAAGTPEKHEFEYERSIGVTVSYPPGHTPSKKAPVLVALPPLMGTNEHVDQGLKSYWESEAAKRGYIVVSPHVMGTTLLEDGKDLGEILFRWMDKNLKTGGRKVALAGACRGGAGVFDLAIAHPDRVHSALVLAGGYQGRSSALQCLKGLPVRFYVGEREQEQWKRLAETTRSALEKAGAEVEYMILEGQGHALTVPAQDLFDWMGKVAGMEKMGAGEKEGASRREILRLKCPKKVSLSLVRPAMEEDGKSYPAVLTLPPGMGCAAMVKVNLETYWQEEAPRRGYYVLCPQLLGIALDRDAKALGEALFEWMGENLQYDEKRVHLAGASMGGLSVFHTALAHPSRFQAIVGLPGGYQGRASDLAPLKGKPVWLIVGENDRQWKALSRRTKEMLHEAGAKVELKVLEGQGHFVKVSPKDLFDWIEKAVPAPK